MEKSCVRSCSELPILGGQHIVVLIFTPLMVRNFQRLCARYGGCAICRLGRRVLRLMIALAGAPRIVMGRAASLWCGIARRERLWVAIAIRLAQRWRPRGSQFGDISRFRRASLTTTSRRLWSLGGRLYRPNISAVASAMRYMLWMLCGRGSAGWS